MLAQTKYIIIQYQSAYPSCKYLRMYAYDYVSSIHSSFYLKAGLNYYYLKRYNLNNKELINEYAYWIDKEIIEYSDQHNIDKNKSSVKEFVENYGYYITFNFDVNKMIRKYHLHSSSYHQLNEKNINNVRFLYNFICRDALGRNFMKQTELLPLVIMCSDVNDTKFWSYSGDLINLHIHSIWISNPVINIDLGQSISSILESDTSGNFDFRDVHIERITSYNPAADTPSRIATYTAKFIPFNTHKLDIASDIRILPEYKFKL